MSPSLPTPGSIRAALARAAPLTVPRWRPLRRDWSRALRGQPPGAVIRLAEALAGGGVWERVTAYELIARHPGALAALTPAALTRLSRGLDDWVGVDTFACYVAGPAWREGRLPTRTVHGWLRSPDRWRRRLAVACTVALNVPARGGRGDAARTLAVCRQVVTDRDDMVVKALSWALRSLIPWDRAAVAAFLAEHGAGLAPRVRREVHSKLATGRKNPSGATRRRSRST